MRLTVEFKEEAAEELKDMLKTIASLQALLEELPDGALED